MRDNETIKFWSPSDSLREVIIVLDFGQNDKKF